MSIAALTAALPNLAPNDRQFAQSLLSAPRLSEKQMFWVGKLVERAAAPPPAPVKLGGEFRAIRDMFTAAGRKLKRPAILLHDGTEPIRLSVAGDGARVPGSINVTTAGSFETRTWLGRILADGSYEPSRKAAPSVAALLTRFSASPAVVAAECGKLMGACSFCSRPLTDARSVEVGYGPVCAENYGLAWGAKAGGAP